MPTRQIGDNEGRAVLHEPADEVHIAAKTVELRHQDRRLELAGRLERGRELGPAIQGIRALAGLRLGKCLDDCEALRLRKAVERVLLRLQAQARSALPLGADPDIGDRWLHD